MRANRGYQDQNPVPGPVPGAMERQLEYSRKLREFYAEQRVVDACFDYLFGPSWRDGPDRGVS